MTANRLKHDHSGGIEGLPLQLMIIILIATIGTGIILSWMGSIETPKSIGGVDVLSETVTCDKLGNIAGDVEILVTDQDGNPLEGATIVLTGMGVKNAHNTTVYGTTDSNGTVSFSDLTVTPPGGAYGYLKINVSKTGYGEDSSARIVVISQKI